MNRYVHTVFTSTKSHLLKKKSTTFSRQVNSSPSLNFDSQLVQVTNLKKKMAFMESKLKTLDFLVLADKVHEKHTLNCVCQQCCRWDWCHFLSLAPFFTSFFSPGREQKRSRCMPFVGLVEETSTPILCQLSGSASRTVGTTFPVNTQQWSSQTSHS